MAKVGVIGGSGFYGLEGIEDIQELECKETPFGYPSGGIVTGIFKGVEVAFLARHGKGHQISPTEVNYRANIFAMKLLGVQAILSVSACGSLRQEIEPLHFVVPDQFVDRTHQARKATFFENGIVAHAALAEPVAPELTKILIAAGKEAGATIHEKGTYINMEGPQFSTKAESLMYRQWGMDIIGMTNMVEAKLAREAEISYASLSAVTDYDCWHEDHESVTIEMILKNLNQNVALSKKIVEIAIPKVGELTEFSASDALKFAIVTSPDAVSEEAKTRLAPIIGKYIK